MSPMDSMKKMLMLKEMRASVWEQHREVAELKELEEEMKDNEHIMIGDMFRWQKSKQGNFLIMENQPASM